MKIAGRIIQNRNISEYDPDNFFAKYKGHQISITTDHGFDKPDFKHLKRFNIEVVSIKTNSYSVDTIKDFNDIKGAIKYALGGACL